MMLFGQRITPESINELVDEIIYHDGYFDGICSSLELFESLERHSNVSVAWLEVYSDVWTRYLMQTRKHDKFWLCGCEDCLSLTWRLHSEVVRD